MKRVHSTSEKSVTGKPYFIQIACPENLLFLVLNLPSGESSGI